ncbi:MAG TPA: hypothetical protein VGC15_17090 [Acetobacteraceae bacterium]
MIDVLLGVVFTFVAVSGVAMAVTEAVASLCRLRQATLHDGIEALLNDGATGLAQALYAHALVNPLSAGSRLTTRPSYVEPRNFALALTDVLQASAPGAPLDAVIADLKDVQVRQTLQVLLREADGDIEQFRHGIADWFRDAMRRLKGWYKRRTQVIVFGAAFLVAALLNADPLRVTTLVWFHPMLDQSLTAPPGSVHLGESLRLLRHSGPIGWYGWHLDRHRPVAGILSMLLGWLTVSAGALLGAPFWFDALQHVVGIRSAGTLAKPAARH